MARCNDPEHMEMPCQCECGDWFDLNDGWTNPRNRGEGEIICNECYRRISQEVEIEEEIADLKERIENAEYELKETRTRLAELTGTPTNS